MLLWVSPLSLSLPPSLSLSLSLSLSPPLSLSLLLTAVQGDWQVLQNPKCKTVQKWLTSHWLPVQRLQFHLWWQWWSLVSCGRADGRHGSLLSDVQLAKYWQNWLSLKHFSTVFVSPVSPIHQNMLSVCLSCVSQTSKSHFLCIFSVSPNI